MRKDKKNLFLPFLLSFDFNNIISNIKESLTSKKSLMFNSLEVLLHSLVFIN